MLTAFALVLVLLTLASIGAGWIIAGRVLRPIARITAAARGISEGTLHERIALDGPRDELRELADTFDTMLARLERAFESRSQFVASASHELLTPLAIVRMELDVTLADPDADSAELRRMAAVIAETNERMEQLVKSLLTLASTEGGIARPRAADLGELTSAVLDAGDGRHAAGDLELRRELAAAPVSGDPVLLERLAENLIANASRYNAPGGFVAVHDAFDGQPQRAARREPGPPAELERGRVADRALPPARGLALTRERRIRARPRGGARDRAGARRRAHAAGARGRRSGRDRHASGRARRRDDRRRLTAPAPAPRSPRLPPYASLTPHSPRSSPTRRRR